MCRRPSRSLNSTVTALIRFLVGQVLQTFFLDFAQRNALHALFFGLQGQLLELRIG